VLAGTSGWRSPPPVIVAGNSGEPASEGGMPGSQGCCFPSWVVCNRRSGGPALSVGALPASGKRNGARNLLRNKIESNTTSNESLQFKLHRLYSNKRVLRWSGR
jgi:hypothetical protein